jgi:hypothetical protein
MSFLVNFERADPRRSEALFAAPSPPAHHERVVNSFTSTQVGKLSVPMVFCSGFLSGLGAGPTAPQAHGPPRRRGEHPLPRVLGNVMGLFLPSFTAEAAT